MLTRKDAASQEGTIDRAAQPSAEPNTDLAIAFLNGLDPKGRHHLTAIWQGDITTASFDAGERERMRRWIDARQGKANLYYSVNAAKSDARRDNKLRKDEIGSIRALAIDVDPTKVKGGDSSGEHFRRERERLLAVAAGAANDPQCPPTLTVDSGGGIQMIWHLEPAVPADGNIERAEGIARTIGARFGGDNTWNIDRIMRLAGTVNVPTPDKAAQGRKPATATVLVEYSKGKPFTIEQLEEWAPPTPMMERGRGANEKATQATVDAGYPYVDMKLLEAVKTYDDLPRDLRERFEARSAADRVLQNLWEGKRAPMQRDETGSGYALALAGSLKAAGNFTPLDFGMLLKVWPDGPDTSKLDQRYIGRTWLRAPIQPTQIDTTAGFEAMGDGKPTFEVPWDEPANLWAETSKPAELPHGVVPPIVERLARDKGRRLGVEPGAIAAGLITALGSLVPARNKLQMRQFDPGWTVRPVLWANIIGDPGTNKSATLGYAMEPVAHVEKGWRAEYASAQRNAIPLKLPVGDDAPAATSNGVFNGAANETKVVPAAAPPFRRKIVRDATTEAIGLMLAENHDGLIYYADELTGWLGNMDAYRAKAGKDRPFWLEAKDGGPYTIDRKTSKTVVIPALAVSVLGGIQPDKIKAVASNLDDDGLLQRFMLIFIDRRGRGVDEAPDPELEATRDKLAVLLAESERSGLFKFEPDANAELLEIEDFKDREINRPNAPPALRQWLDKMPNEFGRLALVFHFIEHHASQVGKPDYEPTPELISQKTAHRARRFLTEFVFSHAQTFYGRVLGQSAMDEHATWVAGYILARGRETLGERELYRAYGPFKETGGARGGRTGGGRNDLQLAMDTLDMQGWVRPIGYGKRGATKWSVNPAVHDGRFRERAHIERSRRTEVRLNITEAAAERREAA
jgi:hypothetical protein